MPSIEHTIDTLKQPDLDSIAKKTLESVDLGNDLITEGVIQMEACVGRNQEAINAFCTHKEVGLFSFDTTRDLFSKS